VHFSDASVMSKVVDIRKADDSRDVIHRAVHLLADGALVALPTETGYVLAAQALQPDAVRKLAGVDHVAGQFCLQLAVKSAQEARDYVPRLSRLGCQLTRRCWPGPVAFVLSVGDDAGLLKALSREIRNTVVYDSRCCFRVPAEHVIREVLRLNPAPLVLVTEYKSSLQIGIARDAETIAEMFGDEVALIISNGPSRYSAPATIVEIENNTWNCLKPGVVADTTIRRMTSQIFVFVCTGNTCRSPLAEGLFRKLLSERLQCSEDELIDHGFLVTSAGLAAAHGAAASQESVSVAAEHGVDLRAHESQPVTEQLLDQADRVFAMTGRHRDSLLAIRPDLAETVELLARDDSDVPDPIGFGVNEYRACEKKIERHVRDIVEGIEVP
jgi:protein-tyrosine phosphatase